MKRAIVIFLLLIFCLTGCSDFRNTLSGFGQNVEKRDKIVLKNKSENYTYKPDYNGELIFISSSPEVASVSEEGVVTPKKSGKTTILASSLDGKFLSSISVEVELEEQENLRGVWVSTVWNIDYPSTQSLSAEKLKSEFDEVVKNAKEWGLNAIFLQVRSMSDAIYPSEIFPSSSFITGKQGDPLQFDILSYAVKKAHAEGLELHAWINPYRISAKTLYGTDFEKLSKTNPARLHPEYTVAFDGALYYNPALPEVRKMITDEITEILTNYDVDGIHFDDYFYPSGSSEKGAFDDSESYEKYGNGKALGDWRRENVNTLIREAYSTVKKINPNCRFGVSPSGIWAKEESISGGVVGLGNTSQSYFDLYADTKKWVEEGIVDYICPQIYWHLESKVAPFEPIAKWWSELCEKNGVDLYIGLGAYRGESDEPFLSPSEIKNELSLLQTLEGYKGEIYFSYSSLEKNLAQIQQTMAEFYK